jgi:hypothetical protein
MEISKETQEILAAGSLAVLRLDHLRRKFPDNLIDEHYEELRGALVGKNLSAMKRVTALVNELWEKTGAEGCL